MKFYPYGEPVLSDDLLAPTEFLDFEHLSVQSFVAEVTEGAQSDTERAIALFNAVRDRIRYDIYSVSADPQQYRASEVLSRGAAYCIPKAVLLAAVARAAGIPAVIGLSDVVNHFTTPKVEAAMGKDAVFLDHGYVAMYLDGKWIKAVPAFNAELCARMGVPPTEFDGRNDALLQQYDAKNNVRMRYLKDHGFWSDLPLRRILDDFRSYYPNALFTLQA